MKRRTLGAFLVVFVLAGCAGGVTSSPGSTAMPSAPDTPSPSEASRVYPYTLPWPDAELEGKWLYADLPWDGEARIDHGNQYTDSVRTQDGDLFAFGHETSGTAADLQELVARQATEWHGCDAEPTDEASLTGGGEDGVLAVHDCGGRTVLRWFAVHDAFGLAVALIVASDADLEVARSHFEDRIGGLVWNG